ncbi:inositol monophosphatase family protein [Phaeacidiphilus oryzae]|uniref:inositol monophosphatase family protein n=1 Tax=Phaeacidiphilus oryzae TaxID=348818 RepID=UPI00068931C4|nr:inositol monophosphatase [Phaeacidiphilus oryzae]
MPDGPDRLLPIAVDACRSAAKLLRGLLGGAEDRLTVREKSADGFDTVTAADLAVEDHLRGLLADAVPGSAVLGEERGGGEAGGGPAPVRWYVDPIDGTGNLLRGIPLAAVSVGAAVGDRVVAGCVLDVFRDECFTGGEGLPFRLETPPGALRVAPAAARKPLVLTDIPLPGRVEGPELAFLAELLTRAEVRRIYSTALSLAWVAAGRADAACNLVIKPWDTAAGLALVRSAGGAFLPIAARARPPPMTLPAPCRPRRPSHPAPALPGFLAHRRQADPALTGWLHTRLTGLALTSPAPAAAGGPG